jgi:hypothetical protein
MTDLFSLCFAKPKPTVLSLELRKKLHAIGWTEIHQSQLSMGRECPQKLHLYLGGQKRTMSCHALLGSVFHRAVELQLPISEMGHDLWIYLMENLITEGNTTYMYRGAPIQPHNVVDLAMDLESGRSLGVSLGELVMKVLDQLKAMNAIILAVEDRMEYVDGGQYPIRFVGTLDLLTSSPIGLGIWDCKTSGLWGPLLAGKGSVKKQSMSHDELFCHTQLRHYEWLRKMLLRDKASNYALMTPANLVPYKVGAEKGQPRGSLVLATMAASVKDIDSYQNDIVNFLSRYVDGPYRAFPTNFGTPLCPGCPYFNTCLRDNTSSQQAAALANNPDLDYLR